MFSTCRVGRRRCIDWFIHRKFAGNGEWSVTYFQPWTKCRGSSRSKPAENAAEKGRGREDFKFSQPLVRVLTAVLQYLEGWSYILSVVGIKSALFYVSHVTTFQDYQNKFKLQHDGKGTLCVYVGRVLTTNIGIHWLARPAPSFTILCFEEYQSMLTELQNHNRIRVRCVQGGERNHWNLLLGRQTISSFH